ncbi:MAG TPA: MarR family transcriptional regulator [Candidatus Dormibacteraeota bacterium]|nr:MarR family transcriptional regulator [Candidatus Dormibacteraeota bacterium]
MPKDWTDNLLERLARARPGLDVDVYQVTARLSRIGQHIARRQEEVFGRFGLNRGEVGVLGALRVAGPPHQLSPTQLFTGLMLSSAGMTSRIDRLERRGFVKRRRDPNDRRGVLVELTDAGRKVVDEAVTANTKSERALLGDMSARQVAALSKLLREMLANMESETLD